ncbi:MAG: hypothetical protein AAF721_37670 [Myxococcota bacterium]
MKNFRLAAAARGALGFALSATQLGCAGESPPTFDAGPGALSGGSDDGGSDDAESDGGDDGERFDLGGGAPPMDPPDEECVAQTLEPTVEHQPIDIILVIDTSDTMLGAIASIVDNINGQFGDILAADDFDYRFIVGADTNRVCISAPLSSTDCMPAPAVPVPTMTYFPYDRGTGSGGMVGNITAWFDQPDPHGLAPMGYMDWLRPDSIKVFIAFTDGQSTPGSLGVAESIDAFFLNETGGLFGTAQERLYTFHTVTALPANEPVTDPYLPTDPVSGPAGALQHLSVITGGWRWPLSQADNFGVLFSEIASGLIEEVPIACSFAVPQAPPGEELDPNTVEIDFHPDDGTPSSSFHQVVSQADCEPDAFWIEGGVVELCEASCAVVQENPGELDVRFGCDVGFDPAG